jgi:hypothetical protein
MTTRQRVALSLAAVLLVEAVGCIAIAISPGQEPEPDYDAVTVQTLHPPVVVSSPRPLR